MSSVKEEDKTWVISYKQLGLLMIVFVIGYITALLFKNSESSTASTFTTVELIGFVMSVVLSGASIVLAIAAIALGKSSEQSVVRRSDESIRLQNEVFLKTTEALTRIEASTGVTEKRIEDIIAGRVGDISKQVAEEVSGGKNNVTSEDIDNLETRLRNSLQKTISSINTIGYDSKIEISAKSKAEELYQINHQELMIRLSNKMDSTERIKHGSSSAKGEEKYDGIFIKGENRIAISTIRPNPRPLYIINFISNVSEDILKGKISKVILIIFINERVEFDSEIFNRIENNLSIFKDEISKKIDLYQVAYGGIDDFIKSLKI